MTGRGSERALLDGPAGAIEVVIDVPAAVPSGVALVAHPHPLFGGSLDNKVAQTLAKTFVELGLVAIRPNFRGVGQSAGKHDEGRGEADDLVAVAEYARRRYGEAPPVLAGFSFGAWVQIQVAQRVPPQRMVLVGVAAGYVSGGRAYAALPVPPDTIVIHGEQDETVPLANVFEWARPLDLPIVVIPGADHFFHRRLHIIKSVIKGQWLRH
jgi:alpha/beta superfamily hydrolase